MMQTKKDKETIENQFNVNGNESRPWPTAAAVESDKVNNQIKMNMKYQISNEHMISSRNQMRRECREYSR